MPGSGDSHSFENLKTYINDIPYDITRSLDGKYFNSNFNGIIIDGNETKEIYIKGDITEENQRTLIFDIYRALDIDITDENGNIITPKPEYCWEILSNVRRDGMFWCSFNPWYAGKEVLMEPQPTRP